MSGSHSPDRAEPNLTPILDMVFQLITFFMLVISFKTTDFDKQLVLPVVGSAAPAEDTTLGGLLILNLRSGGRMFVQGKEQSNIEGYIGVESKYLKSKLTSDADKEQGVTVVIRADRTLRCEFLMRVVNACRSNGLDRFDFMVLRGGAK
ncbi:MAG: biopolymer transporter ExbD [Pirellulales bacterium]